MARKSKRLVLNEAIRQGQAKIQQGLINGQMRSDRGVSQSGNESQQGVLNPEKPTPFKPDRKTFLSKDRIKFGRVWVSWQKVVLYAGSVIGLAVVLWTTMAIFSNKPPSEVDNKPPSNAGSSSQSGLGTSVESIREISRFGNLGAGDNSDEKNEDKKDSKEPVVAVVSSGDNVIWIVSISLDRKSELFPVLNFFKSKGIETEIIAVNGKAALVTKAGFDQNPVKKGTQGYDLYLQIKQMGSLYVKEMDDTKFGQTPFQDIYGYKRQ